MSKKFKFFREAVKNYKTSGTIIPSSRFLADKMLKSVNFSKAKVIVELGPGNGAITRRILKRIHPETLLICFEINDAFYEELLKINHPQLKILKKSATELERELKQLGFSEVDYVISSLPLTILPKKLSFRILKLTKDVLKQNGVFLQYQYSLTYYRKLKAVFGENIVLKFETLNIPPAFIYKWTKK